VCDVHESVHRDTTMKITDKMHYGLTLILLMWRIYWAPNSIPIYIQQGATLNSLLISGSCSTYFWWYFQLSSGEQTTVFTASGIYHNVTAICRYRGRVGTGLCVPWEAYVRHSQHTQTGSVSTHSRHQPAATWVNTIRYCKYSQVLPMMGENIAQNMYSWLGIIN
jgi:hypothetical protein